LKRINSQEEFSGGKRVKSLSIISKVREQVRRGTEDRLELVLITATIRLIIANLYDPV